MEIDDHNFKVVRKNLNILSVLILILAYTNAQLHEINLLGIEMELDSQKLYIALFLGYMYFIWRYMTKLNFMGGFWNDFMQYYMVSESGVKKKHNFEKYKERFIAESSRLQEIIDRDPDWRIVSTGVTRMGGDPVTKLKLTITAYTHILELNMNQYHEIEIFVSRWYLVWRLIVFSLKDDKFGDYLFPLVPVLMNIGFFVLKQEWQGSFSSLFR